MIVDAAIEILDAEGEEGLTFRALSVHLATGAGAIYNHLANKAEILLLATSTVVRRRVAEVADHDDGATGVRELMDDLFTVIDDHPWVGAQLSREPWQPAMAAVFLRVAEYLRDLGVPQAELFGATSALANLLLGVAAQYAAAARLATGDDRSSFLGQVAGEWRAEGRQSPLSQYLADQLAQHDDRSQFRGSVELILAGIGRAT